MFKISAILLTALMFGACMNDVPHENPLDPDSEDFVETGIVRGDVRTFYQPRESIHGVKIELWPGNITTESDSSGDFNIRNVPVGDYWITAHRAEFASDSTRITVNQEEVARVEFQLDALPKIQNVIGKTFHLADEESGDDVFFAHFEVKADDPDGPGDVAGIITELTVANRIDSMQATSRTGVFDLQIFANDLAEGVFQRLPGHRILFTAIDRLGKKSATMELFLVRIIDESPVIASPTDNAIVNDRPVLTWETIDLSFPFNFRVQVDRLRGGIRRPVWTSEEIPSFQTSITLDQSLTANDYIWTVAIEDEFENTSISQPAAFKVE